MYPTLWDWHLHHTLVAHRKELVLFQGNNLWFKNGQHTDQRKSINYLMLRLSIKKK